MGKKKFILLAVPLSILLILGYSNCGRFSTSSGPVINGQSVSAGNTVLPTPTPAPNPNPLPAPAPLPVPIPGPNPYPLPAPVPIPISGVYPKIVSNFNVASWITGTIGSNIPSSAAPDNVGAFRFICTASHLLYDDPIVYPGKPGAAHLHQFFGNTLANAQSTYESLRTTGEGTCDGGPINRSGYWAPAMMDGKGKVVVPDYAAIYYKAEPRTVHLPRGLRMVFGFDMAKTPSEPWTVYSPYYWICDKPNAGPNHYPDIAAVIAAGCPVGNSIHAVVHTPECWDGKNLDSPNHRSHMAYKYNPNTDGRYICPITHPVVLPIFTLRLAYTHQGPADLTNWYLSSDHMAGTPAKAAGSTFHSDWFGAWDDNVMDTWMANAIDKLLNSSAGELGNGQQLVRPPNFKWLANPRLVDPPVIPASSTMSGMLH